MSLRPKTATLLALPALAFVFGCLDYGPARGPQGGSAAMTIHAGLSLALLCVWFLIDAAERAYKPSLLLKIAMAALTVFAFPYYLFRSRGPRDGFKALAWSMLVFAGTMVAYDVGSWFA